MCHRVSPALCVSVTWMLVQQRRVMGDVCLEDQGLLFLHFPTAATATSKDQNALSGNMDVARGSLGKDLICH